MAGCKALFQLDGKVALVTGAACGIGSEACRAVASAGAAWKYRAGCERHATLPTPQSKMEETCDGERQIRNPG